MRFSTPQIWALMTAAALIVASTVGILPVGARTAAPVVAVVVALAIAGLAALATVDPGLPRHTAASAYLHEKAGDILTAARLYANAARYRPNLTKRHHLTRQAARINQAPRG